MKAIGKKTLAWLLSVLLIAGCCLVAGVPKETVSAAATASGTCGTNLTWELKDWTLTISGTGAMKNYSRVNSKSPWYTYRSQFRSVVIEEGITSIGEFAFYDCYSLTEISLPDSLISIGEHAFYDCYSLTDITLPDNLTNIRTGAFWNCESLTEIFIPDSVTSISNGAFLLCDNLAEILVSKNNSVYASQNGVLFNKEMDNLIIYPEGKEGICVVPKGVTVIGNEAFFHCYRFTEIILPDSLTSIGNYAFSQCLNLTDVYYNGSKLQWNEITIRSNNTYLTNATIHYNSTGPEEDIDLPFADIQDPDTYYYGAVQYVYENGLMTGMNPTTFAPAENLSRAHFATILYRMAGSPSVAGMENPFEDNQSGAFYYDAAIWCNNAGILTGYYNPDGSFTGRFGPSDNITREQLATMLYRYADYIGADTSARTSLDGFGDGAAVSSFAVEALEWAAAEGIVSGRATNPPTIAPQDNASRADTAVMIQRFLV